MSAPPLLTMPTMVSRLPKFGSKPKSPTLSTASSTNTRLTNGFYHHPGPAGVNGSSSYTAPAPVKQNGFIRVPTKWRKENEEEGGATGIRSAINNNNHQLNLQGKTAISSTGKGRGFGFPSSSSPSPQSSPRLTQVRQQPSPNLNPSPTLNPSPSPTINPSPSSPLSHSSTNMATAAQTPPKGVLVKPKKAPPPAPSTGPASKPSGISYRLSRPSLIKQSRPLRVTTANGSGQEVNRGPTARSNSVETPSTTENSPESPTEAPERGLSAAMVAQREVSILGETLEDMSLSSNSSLDRNDTSQEYMDDFDNLGNGGMGILLLSSKNDEDDSGLDQSCARFNEEDKMAVSGVSKAGLCFLDDGVDWCAENRLIRLPHRRRSNQQEDHEQGGSSLDLSPSDSCGSGGTYLWDEEGLEPLVGGNASIHSNSNNLHIGSFDSDLNSIDVLDNLESCDLDDDDLMLDEDLPEDDSLRSDGEGLAHMAQWRMRQLCWGNDNESDLESYKLTEDPGNKRTDGDLILDFSSSRNVLVYSDHYVEDLAEDCSAVRSQLEFLQKLLLQEVQQLREDLRSRDRTIAQLTLQLQTVPIVTGECCCREKTERHTQTSSAERESVTTQTPWREHPSQISHAPPLRREESCDRKQQIRPPQPSKLHLFTASKTSASSGSKVKPAPPALSRLPKPKSH
ncbi:Serine-rich coiled-coil domain containing protein 2 [Dissostichus eleginoides]|uniref:Serine-rich coiled-coil domain containing protein 2 n=1 Tax=Dissostichus eleginoides TaxID=100907 RepID=A0AAD9BG43_DISEL|nr:Serine-rich coiled-coil domain containing protein 2 [Dissostichus eleginoides]